jgi:hypothetical protein
MDQIAAHPGSPGSQAPTFGERALNLGKELPIVGPIGEDIANGNWRGLTGDALAAATTVGLPKLLEGSGYIPRQLGNTMYESGLRKVINKNPDVPVGKAGLEKVQDVVNYAKENNKLLPLSMGENEKVMNQGSQEKTTALANAQTTTPHAAQFMDPLINLAKSFTAAGRQIPEPLMDKITEYSKKGRQPLAYWQKLNEGVNGLLKSKAAMDPERTGLDNAILKAEASGLSQGLNQVVPGLEDAKTKIHRGLVLQKGQAEWLRHAPSVSERAVPITAGAATAAATPGAVNMLHNPLTPAAIMATLSRMGMSSPQALGILGKFLSNTGQGFGANTLSTLSRLAYLRPNTSDQQ